MHAPHYSSRYYNIKEFIIFNYGRLYKANQLLIARVIVDNEWRGIPDFILNAEAQPVKN